MIHFVDVIFTICRCCSSCLDMYAITSNGLASIVSLLLRIQINLGSLAFEAKIENVFNK